MSSRSFWRIPESLRYLLKIYEKASQSSSVYTNAEVRSFLRRSSEEYKSFQNFKLIRSNQFDSNEFQPIISESIKPYFNEKLKFNSIEDIPTHQLFNITKKAMPDSEDSIHSSYSRTISQTSDYFAKIVASFASVISPRKEVPDVPSLQNSFKWYTKLLNNTPIILFLSSKNRLFSSTSLSQIDKAFIDLDSEITDISNELGKDIDRSYHFTKLESIDIFNLAVKNHDKFYKQNISDFDQILSSISWNQAPEDKLCDSLMSQKVYEVIDRSFKPVSQHSFEHYLTYHRYVQIMKTRNIKEVIDSFPYDLIYSTKYMLCIENSVVDSDYSKIIHAIKSSDFEVIGARLSLDNPVIRSALPTSQSVEQDTASYDSLLQMAKSDRKKDGTIKSLISFFARINLIRVELNNNQTSVYFLPPPPSSH